MVAREQDKRREAEQQHETARTTLQRVQGTVGAFEVERQGLENERLAREEELEAVQGRLAAVERVRAGLEEAATQKCNQISSQQQKITELTAQIKALQSAGRKRKTRGFMYKVMQKLSPESGTSSADKSSPEDPLPGTSRGRPGRAASTPLPTAGMEATLPSPEIMERVNENAEGQSAPPAADAPEGDLAVLGADGPAAEGSVAPEASTVPHEAPETNDDDEDEDEQDAGAAGGACAPPPRRRRDGDDDDDDGAGGDRRSRSRGGKSQAVRRNPSRWQGST